MAHVFVRCQVRALIRPSVSVSSSDGVWDVTCLWHWRNHISWTSVGCLTERGRLSLMQSLKSLELGTNRLAYWPPVAKSKTVLSGLGGRGKEKKEKRQKKQKKQERKKEQKRTMIAASEHTHLHQAHPAPSQKNTQPHTSTQPILTHGKTPSPGTHCPHTQPSRVRWFREGTAVPRGAPNSFVWPYPGEPRLHPKAPHHPKILRMASLGFSASCSLFLRLHLLLLLCF